MTPADRAAMLAVPVVTCESAGVDATPHLAPASRDDLTALVRLLARAADLSLLKAVIDRPAEPVESLRRDMTLRAAHATVRRLTTRGLPVPVDVRDLDNEYWRSRDAARAIARALKDARLGTTAQSEAAA